MIKEFCAENFTNIPRAITAGARRIELCDNLAIGGTTPSLGVLELTVKYAHEKDVPVMCMIRPRGGSFVYTDIELKMMERDILAANECGCDGVVVGALDNDHWLDEEAMESLLMAAGGMQKVFHMAFDEIPEEKQFEAIDWLVEHGVDRILTHGGSLDQPISNYFEKLKRLVEYAESNISVLVGGGVTYENVEDVLQKTSAKEVHGTKVVDF